MVFEESPLFSIPPRDSNSMLKSDMSSQVISFISFPLNLGIRYVLIILPYLVTLDFFNRDFDALSHSFAITSKFS